MSRRRARCERRSTPARERAGAVRAMRLALALLALLVFAAPAAAADVEGYHDPGDRIACIMVKRGDGATAVRCGAHGRTRGLLLNGSGAARSAAWSWPA